MKYRVTFRVTDDAPLGAREILAGQMPPGVSATNYAGFLVYRDSAGLYLEMDGRPSALVNLPKGMELVRWAITDSGTLDRPRAGTYALNAATGYVSVFETFDRADVIKWTVEVISTNLPAALQLFDGIRDGSIRPTNRYRAARWIDRCRQNIYVILRRWRKNQQ